MRNLNLFSFIQDGENFIKLNCPEIYGSLVKPRLHARRMNATDDNAVKSAEGFQDMLDVQDISYDAGNRTLKAVSVAGFTECKGVITIVSEVFDSVTGESIKGSAVTVSNSHTLVCSIDSVLSEKHQSKESHLTVRSVFYWTETEESGDTVLKSHEVRRECGLTCAEGDEIVKNITVNFPNTLKPRDYTVVLYNRTAEQHMEDPDKEYPGVSPINGKLPFYIPFTGSVSVNVGKIVGVDKAESIIRLQHPEKKTEVTFNKDKDNNWSDIKWKYLSNNTVLQWEFPENWRNSLDLKDLSAKSIFDFYARLVVKVDVAGDGLATPIPITIGSNVEQDSTHCKIKQVFLQWGCLGEDSVIAMADGSQKKISKIYVGDIVDTGNGSAVVKEIYSGFEEDIICIETETAKRLLLTAGHPVLTDRGWMRAGDINAATGIMTVGGTYEKLNGVYILPYGRKVYNLYLSGDNAQLIADGIIVGDFTRQNDMRACSQNHEILITGQEDIAKEFQILVKEINRQNGW